jgi:uncharacterized YccA/Bax inhibitor family protein
MFRSSNPFMKNVGAGVAGAFDTTGVMSFDGFINKAGILLAVLVFSFAFVMSNMHIAGAVILPSAIIGFILALMTMFMPGIAHITAPLYALCEGALLGGVSGYYEARFGGIVSQAVMLTFGVFGAMLFIYKARIVRVTEKFKSIMLAALIGIAITYLVSFVAGLCGLHLPLFSTGPIGIGVSLLVTGIAAFSLLLDFDRIENAIGNAPKQMEWYSAFGLLVTLVWLYMEILRLLMIMQSSRD